jgi:hypothetical protein
VKRKLVMSFGLAVGLLMICAPAFTTGYTKTVDRGAQGDGARAQVSSFPFDADSRGCGDGQIRTISWHAFVRGLATRLNEAQVGVSTTQAF